MGRAAPIHSFALAAFAMAAAIGSSSCAHVANTSAPHLDTPDSTTVASWHMEDQASDQILDSGPLRLHGVAGEGLATDDGYAGLAKVFDGGPEDFVYVPHAPALDALGTMVIESWIKVDADGGGSIQVIAGRWNLRMGEQSWVFFLGWPTDQTPPEFGLLFPTSYMISSNPFDGPLYFAVMSDKTTSPQLYSANGGLTYRHGWNHVAVSMDGKNVAFYINGELDSTFPCNGRIARTIAPLTIGNLVDVKLEHNNSVWYRGIEGLGFAGRIDEVRISRIGRVQSLALHGDSGH